MLSARRDFNHMDAQKLLNTGYRKFCVAEIHERILGVGFRAHVENFSGSAILYEVAHTGYMFGAPCNQISPKP